MPEGGEPRPQRDSLQTAVAALLLAGLSAAAFYRVVGHQFLNWDDQANVYQNPDLNPVTLRAILWNFTHTRLTLYMPIAYVVWGALAIVARQGDGTLNPAVFHAFNLAVHVLTAVAVYLLLRRLRFPPVAAWFGAAVFAVHPVQVEAVAWVSGMYTLLGGLLCYVALIEYLRYAEASQAGSGETAPAWHYALASAAFVLALFTKPASVAVVPMAGLIDVLLVRRRVRAAVLPLLPWAAAGLVMAVVASRFQDVHFRYPPPWKRPAIAFDALTAYLKMLAAPVHLSPDMGRPPDRLMASPEVYYTWIPSAALLCVAAATWRRYPRFAAAVGLFVAGLLPYLGFTPFDFQPFSTVAQRYAYLAMLGVAMAVAIVVDRAQDRPPWALPLSAGAVIALAVWTNLQTRYWRDTVTLFTHTLEVRPDSVMAHNILGYLDQQQGRLEGAMAHYDAVFRVEPLNPQANFNAGNIFLSLNRPADALPFYEKAIQQAPAKPAYRDNLGIAFVQTGRPDEGLRWFHEALRLDPGDASAHANIGKVLRDRGDYAGAIDEYQKALAIQPDLPAARRGLTAALETARAAATRPTQ